MDFCSSLHIFSFILSWTTMLLYTHHVSFSLYTYTDTAYIQSFNWFFSLNMFIFIIVIMNYDAVES